MLLTVALGVGVIVLFAILARLAPSLVRRVVQVEAAAKLAGRAVAAALIVLGIFIGLSFFFRTQEVALTGIILGTVVASIGVQDLLKNYVSGFYILFERNIRVGDVIEFDGRRATVTEVRLRVTYLRTDDGALVVVPNANLFNETVVVRSPAGGAPEAAGEQPREQT